MRHDDRCADSGGISEHRKRRVLIVDDNEDAGRILAELLSVLGYEARPFSRAADALLYAELSRPDVCILDLNMPEMDGYQLATALRKQDAFKRLVLIAYTAHTLPAHRAAALDAGFDEHLSKPADMESILSAIGPPTVHITE